VGSYNPFAQHLDGIKEVRLRLDRIKYWISVGAQPSDRVAYLLWRAGMLPPPPIRFQTQYNVSTKALKEAAEAAKKKGYHTLAGGAAEAAAVGGSSGDSRGITAGALLRCAALRQPLGLFSSLIAR